MSTIYFIPLHESLVNRVFSKVRFRARRHSSYLYHYTIEKGFSGIVERSRLWATSAADSPKNDKDEIAYGCDLFAQLIERRMASRKVSTFTGRILNELRSLPRERLDKIFLASFCEMDDYKKMWREFGGFCLRFLANPQTGVGMVAPRGLATGRGFVTEMTPAIYDRSEQQTALTSLLDLLIEILEDPSLITGPDPGIWAAESARFIAFTVADFALSFIVPLKRSEFRDEREWRIVARPSHTHFSSDPTEADRNCECFIKAGPSKRYVELAPLEPEQQLISGVPFGLPTNPPKLPINAVRVGPCEQGDKMAGLARRSLDKHGLRAAQVLRSEISTSLDCR